MVAQATEGPEAASVLLYWLPLGAGGHSVRWNGRVYEAVAAGLGRRPARDLYHAGLEINIGLERWVVEMTPAWGSGVVDRGVVREGPVGMRGLGRFLLFRYEVRCWPGGAIPDLAEAVGGPRQVGQDCGRARRLLDLVPRVPAMTWGRDELGAGDMWNSNSLVAWLLARSGHNTDRVLPPANGRAPGWAAGLVLAERQRRADAGDDDRGAHVRASQPLTPTGSVTSRRPGTRRAAVGRGGRRTG